MAEAMQGVMSLVPEMSGQGNAAKSYLTPEDDATLNELRNSISPQQFNTEMFSAAEEADPQAVAELRTMLRGMQLPQELIDLMKEMVDALLQEPNNYAQNRQELIKEGVPEDLLPAEFDPMYLMALDMALDQVSEPVIQGFARGGMVKNPISAGIASLGRGGDKMLAHITPREARMLMRAGGAGTINPVTGLPEFFIKKAFKAVGRAFTSVGKAIKGAVRGIGRAVKKFASSTVGRIVTSVALGFFLGPAAASMLGVTSSVGVAAISGFVGSAGSTLMAGGSISEALKSGAMGGLTAGAFSGVMGGASAFKSGSYTGPTTVSESWKSFTDTVAGKPAVDVTKAAGAADEAAAAAPAAPVSPAAAGAADEAALVRTSASPPVESAVQNLDDLKYDVMSGKTAAVPTQTGLERIPSDVPNLSSYTGTGARVQPSLSGTNVPPATPAPPLVRTDLSSYTGTGARVQPSMSGAGLLDDDGFRMLSGAEAQSVYAHPNYNPALSANAQYDKLFPSGTATQPVLGGGLKMPGEAGPLKLDAMSPAAAPSQGVMDLVGQGKFVEAGKTAATKVGDVYDEFFSPAGLQQKGTKAALEKTAKDFGVTTDQVLNATPGSVLSKAYEANMPGMLATYGPLAGATLGAAYLGGAFDTPEPPPKPEMPTSGAELYRQNPYYLTPDVRTVSASTGQAYRYATGGIASLKRGTSSFPRKTGPIDGPGTGTSDSIPAMLSDGEFVFTAKAVRAMGNGSRRKGAKRMYALMKALEKRT
jgi:hypothetical protein